MSDEQDFWTESVSPGSRGGGELSRGAKVLLGVLTFWPPVYLMFFVGMIAVLITLASTSSLISSGGASAPVLGIVPFLHIFTIFEMMGLTVFYGVNVYRDAALQGDRKLLWMLVVLLGGFIGQAIYYVLWIVKRHPGVLGTHLMSPAAPSASESRPPE